MPSMATEPLAIIQSSNSLSAAKVIFEKWPLFSMVFIVAVPSIWPRTKWPPNRPLAFIARSIFTCEPLLSEPSAVLVNVSLLISNAAMLPCRPATVRHTPLTSILSPALQPSASPPVAETSPSARTANSIESFIEPAEPTAVVTLQIASIIPVNINESL